VGRLNLNKKILVKRDSYSDLVNLQFTNLSEYDRNVIIEFYGVGGVGKSTLFSELQECFENKKKSDIVTFVDFEQATSVSKIGLLIELRNQIRRREQVSFSKFDTVVKLYRKKNGTYYDNKSNKFDLWDEGSLLSSVGAELFWGDWLEFIPKSLQLLIKYFRIIPAFIKRIKVKNYKSLKRMGLNELENKIISIFLEELKEFQTRKQTRVMFVFDTTEKVFKENKFSLQNHDVDWVYELTNSLTSFMFVFVGRETYNWNHTKFVEPPFILKQKVENLTKTETTSFCKKNGIYDISIQEVIYESTQGFPFTLNICFEIFRMISKSRNPIVDDFEDIMDEKLIVDRFMSHIDDPNIHYIVVLLSRVRLWDEALLYELCKEFNVSNIIGLFDKILGYSFIIEINDKMFKLHDNLVVQLESYLSIVDTKRVNNFLINYYSSLIESDEYSEIDKRLSIKEALYHQLQICDEYQELENIIEWLFSTEKTYYDIADWDYISNLYIRILTFIRNKPYIDNNQILYSKITNAIGVNYFLQGRYYEAEDMYKIAYNIQVNCSDNTYQISQIENNLATLYRKMQNYDQAFILYDKALNNRLKSVNEDSVDVGRIINNLANINADIGNYLDAMELYNKALTIYCDKRNTRVGLKEFVWVLFDYGKLLLVTGLHEEALCWFEYVLDKRKEVSKNHPDVAKTLISLGDYYKVKNDYILADDYYLKAYKIFEKTENSFVSFQNDILVKRYELDFFMQNDMGNLITNSLELREYYINSKWQNIRYIIKLNILIGKLYKFKRKFRKALYYFEEALSLIIPSNKWCIKERIELLILIRETLRLDNNRTQSIEEQLIEVNLQILNLSTQLEEEIQKFIDNFDFLLINEVLVE